MLWSDTILEETTRHLVGNVDGFIAAQGERLTVPMNRAYPGALVEITKGVHRAGRVIFQIYQGDGS